MKTVQENKNAYDKAISILTSQGKFHIKLGLERVSKLLELVDNPQDSLKIIHVAGTNGKGSTCAMLASILTEAGYKTGLYTSPHLVDYTERIKINDNEISREDFASLIIQLTELAEKNNIPATEFELLTVMAFMYFKDQNADFVVLETGLGGRFDATNIIKSPLVSVITSIDLDHTDRLGDTVEKIAFEKAGIIKPDIPIVTLVDNNGIEIIKDIANQRSSQIILADSSKFVLEKDFKILTGNQKYELPLLGFWQIKNLSLVLKTVELLGKLGILVSETALKSGLKKVNWQGRMQYIKEKNLIIDGAHNPSAAKLLKESLDFYFPDKKRIWIYSSINTKDYESIIKILFKKDDIVILTKSSSMSAVDPEELEKKILFLNPNQIVKISQNIKEAVRVSDSCGSFNSLTIVAGSLYTIGELLA